MGHGGRRWCSAVNQCLTIDLVGLLISIDHVWTYAIGECDERAVGLP